MPISNRKLGSALRVVLCVLTAAVPLRGQSASSGRSAHAFFRVQIASTVAGPVSGRLLLFLKAGSGDPKVSISEFHPGGTWVAAQEVHDVDPGSTVEFDADQIAFPKPFAALPAGIYEAQAVLDVDHNYNYKERVQEDWISPVVTLAGWKPGAATEPVLTLDRHPVEDPQRISALARLREVATPDVAQLDEFESPMLSRFWGHTVKIRAWVILPPNYARQTQTFPTAYWTHGFGGDIDGALVSGLRIYERMKQGRMPPMFWVMLDESLPEGTHEFADSVNDGPWGTALTSEYIPHLEKKYRMDARPQGRLLNGHSSGGWATLQLQVIYPKVFGGTWSTSPDPSDFHDFTGADLYAANANVYHHADGTPIPLFRDKGKVIATFEQLTRLEQVLGTYGGQISSFDWVFSPKGPSGAPEQMFDHVTGAVHPDVVAYWRAHYDLAHIVETTWAERGADLKGKIHLLVGTADTFYLDGAAHKFEAVLTKVNAEPHFSYLQDRTHFDLYEVGKDRQGLFDQIGAEMYAVARPGVKWQPQQAPNANQKD
jgi:S-formylglutathione hydrolase FrmB